ncbi:MAG: imidazole glycerol phosphate synthase subunit HisH, partial [Methylococcales bacterium]|nr:imidazole glycerol phosphate synthase subunit HisH [Methylococcales bacterium]
MSTVAVIDYGMGNLHSISKALQHAAPDVNVVVTSDADTILNADYVVFPGVGA